MKKLLIPLCLLLALSNYYCSPDDGTIRIVNYSATNIYFIFRASMYSITPDGESTINNIPRESYNFSTIYEIPLSLQIDSAATLSGTLTFADKSRYLIVYSSYITNTSYHV
jgi:hypothetical protein